MAAVKSINLAIRFAFELCAIVALAYVLFGAAAFANIALVYALEGEAGGGATVSR